MIVRAGILAVLLGGLAAPVLAADYREGLPEVLGGDEPVEREELAPPEGQVRADFARAYAEEGEPRIAVFWNRAFSDRLSQWAAEGRLLVTREGQAGIEVRGDRRGDTRGRIRGDESATLSYQRNRPERAQGRDLSPLAAAEFESAFARPMLEAGVALVDRAAIMRFTDSNLTRQAGQDSMPDAQRIETEALKGFADYVAEVTMMADQRATTGRTVRIVVKRIPDGVLVADVLATARSPGGKRWVAGPDGYVEVGADDPMSASDLGRTAALRTMEALARAWE